MACLRDIRKWLKLYDDKTNRLDVARCLGEANVVNGDLLPILGLWYKSEGYKKKHLTRVALACCMTFNIPAIRSYWRLMMFSGIAGPINMASRDSWSDDR